ncbi:MAG: NAD(P)-dependent alcohol dehydrogenase [Egibacteraceae bacterium]
MATITAAIIHKQYDPFQIEELTLEGPRDDEVLVRTVATGLCHTDIICRDQWYPVPLPCVFGHEGAGVVEAVGRSVKKVSPGDHVVMSFLSCGACKGCKRGTPAYCSNFWAHNLSGGRADGSTSHRSGSVPIHDHFFGQSSFASMCLANERNVVKVDPEVDLKLLGPLGCGISTGFGATVNSLHPHGGSSIVIFGTGAVGLASLMGAYLTGCSTIVAVDLKRSRLEKAEQLGATHTLNPASVDNVVEAIQEITRGGADFSLDTTGSPEVFRQAVDCLAVKGKCGLIGVAPIGQEASFDMNTILFGRTITGIIEGDSVPDLLVPTMVELIKQGRFRLPEIITYYKFEDINQAGEDSLAGKAIKPVLTFE